MTIKIKFAMYSVLYCVNYFLLLGMIIRYGHYYFRPGFCRNLLMVVWPVDSAFSPLLDHQMRYQLLGWVMLKGMVDVVVVVVVVEIFIRGAVNATVTNAPQSQLNKWVFSSFLNWPTVVSDWHSEAGRLFQSLGPATWKARSPKPVRVRETTQVETSDERSRRRPTSETSWQSSDK